MTTPSPGTETSLPRSISSRFIATEIIRIRNRANRSGEWVAGKMDWSPSKQSRIEHGRIPLPGRSLPQLLDIIGATDGERARILDAAVNGDPSNSYDGALGVLEWGAAIFPGSLQCPAYAWALETALAEQVTRISPAAAEAAVNASLRWQRIALDGRLQVEALFDESCLTRQYGGPDVMANQVRYVNWLGSLDNVSIRMIPVSARSVPPVGSFTYVRFPSDRGLSTADLVLERRLHGEEVVDSDSAYLYHTAFQELKKTASSEARTRAAVERAGSRWSRRSVAA
jgi:hypothetical protein